jgi:hypothetical protein
MATEATIFVAGPIPLVTTAETVVAAIPPFSSGGLSGQGVRLHGVVNLTGGTGNTNMLVRVRQTDINGSVVGNGASNDSVGAGTIRSIPYSVLDTSPPAGTVVYVVTVQAVAASGNGTVNRASLTATPNTSLS